jgi:PPM family protein phosphatase
MENYRSKLRSRISCWLHRQNRAFGVQEMEGNTALGTSLGIVRPENQDRAVFARYSSSNHGNSFCVWALCDGIGGLQDGSACAEHVLSDLLVTLLSGTTQEVIASRVGSAVQAANQQVFQAYHERGGSTLTLVTMDSNGHGVGVSVGDSRLYSSVAGKDVQQLSRDDTIGNQLRLLGDPSISPTGGIFSNHLSQYLGIGAPLDIRPIDLPKPSQGTSLILSSDGAHSLPQEMFKNIAISAPSLLETARRVLYVSKWNGGKDNASIICFSSQALVPMPRLPAINVLEIWDPFGKAEFFIDPQVPAEIPKQSEPAQRPMTTDKAEPRSGAPKDLHFSKKKQRRRYGKHDKPSAQIEIVETNQEQPAR